MLPFPLAVSDLLAVLQPLERARGLPREAYLDEQVFDFEMKQLLGRAWLCVGRECEVRYPGEFLTTRVGNESVLLVRGPDCELRAFHNVCRHRGLSLVEEEAGRCAGFSCPYHGWRYELSGQLRGAPHMPGTFDPAQHALSSVRVETLHGFIFVCLSPEVAPLSEALGDIPDWLQLPELQHLRLARRYSYEVQANWKLCVENFQESHHFQHIHPQLERLTPSAGASSWQRQSSPSSQSSQPGQPSSGAWLGGIMQLADHTLTVSSEELKPGTPLRRPWLVPPEQRRRVADAFAFPNLLTSLQPDYLLTYHLQPLGVTRTRVVSNTYFHAAAFKPEAAALDVIEFWNQVNAEDRNICERQQRGLASRSFRAQVYSLVEDGVHAFDQKVARCYLSALAEAEAP